MTPAVTTTDILHSIEFELAQSAISRTELGDGLNAVRQLQNKARTATFESNKAFTDMRAVITQQYQINDMHLTLLQELTAAVQAMQLDVRRVSQLPPRESRASVRPSALPTRLSDATSGSSSPVEAASVDELPGDWPDGDVMPLWSDEPIEAAMKPDLLKQKIDVRPVTTPLVGGLIRRVRAAFHSLTLFYVQQIGQKQTGVNQVYGERLLQLTALVQQQQQQIEALHAQVVALTGQSSDTAA